MHSILLDMHYRFHHAIVGGTFDRFHLGHQKLLTSAFAQSEKVTIGIATDELIKDKSLATLIEAYETRNQSVSNFLSEQKFANRFEIIPIYDIYGNSLTDTTIDAIFVTDTTKTNALKINEKRKEKGFAPLEIITVPFVLGDDGEIISSERIRKGEIDREGKSYVKLFLSQEVFHLPEDVRQALRDPIGHVQTDMSAVVTSLDSKAMVITVGDIVTSSIVQEGRPADIAIIDGKTRRAVVEPENAVSIADLKRSVTKNPAGTITQKAVKT